MSTPPSTSHDTDSEARSEQGELGDVGANAIAALRWAARAGSFWLAVVLPFLYLPLLLFGLEGNETLWLFVVFVGVNALALYVGHNYRRTEFDELGNQSR